MFKLQDLGEIAYGGAVVAAEWWDEKRMTAAAPTLTEKELLKKAGFWTYLGIGIPATIMMVFDWPKFGALKPWAEHVSHGFLYDLPRQTKNAVTALRTTTPAAARTNSNNAAVREAQNILRQRQAILSRSGSTGGRATSDVMPEVITKRGM